MTQGCDVWIYGSRARGDWDDLSDTDVLVVSDGLVDAASMLDLSALPRLSCSRYTWAEILGMASYGSLFLHHVAAEGVPLWTSSAGGLRRILDGLPPFSRARRDLESFRAALRDARKAMLAGGWPDFEFEVLGTVVRHAAILGSYCAGAPAFGREEPFYVVGDSLGYSRDRTRKLATGATQYRYRLVRPDGPDGLTGGARDWFENVTGFLVDLGPLIDEYEGLLSRAA